MSCYEDQTGKQEPIQMVFSVKPISCGKYQFIKQKISQSTFKCLFTLKLSILFFFFPQDFIICADWG